jgi:hypothetical protein
MVVIALRLAAQPAPVAPAAPAAPVAPVAPVTAADPFLALAFLEGTWDARAQGDQGVAASGTYTFARELGGHVLARHSTGDAGCKGPASFDCEHRDLLLVYQDAAGQPLKAIYFDNEGHVIHYDVATPGASTAAFLSDPAQPGPRFRLIYQLQGGVMSGKFQMRLPGQADWKSYLEWSGKRK